MNWIAIRGKLFYVTPLAQKPGPAPIREADIRQALREVIDPEVGISVVDLGLIKEIALNGRGVEVRMVLTSPTCTLARHLVEQVRRRVRSVTGGEPVEVVLLDRIWSWEDIAPRLFWGMGYNPWTWRRNEQVR